MKMISEWQCRCTVCYRSAINAMAILMSLIVQSLSVCASSNINENISPIRFQSCDQYAMTVAKNFLKDVDISKVYSSVVYEAQYYLVADELNKAALMWGKAHNADSKQFIKSKEYWRNVARELIGEFYGTMFDEYFIPLNKYATMNDYLCVRFIDFANQKHGKERTTKLTHSEEMEFHLARQTDLENGVRIWRVAHGRRKLNGYAESRVVLDFDEYFRTVGSGYVQKSTSQQRDPEVNLSDLLMKHLRFAIGDPIDKYPVVYADKRATRICRLVNVIKPFNCLDKAYAEFCNEKAYSVKLYAVEESLDTAKEHLSKICATLEQAIGFKMKRDSPTKMNGYAGPFCILLGAYNDNNKCSVQLFIEDFDYYRSLCNK